MTIKLEGITVRDKYGTVVLGIPTRALRSLEPVRQSVAPLCEANGIDPNTRCYNYAWLSDHEAPGGAFRLEREYPRMLRCRSHWLDLWAAENGISPSSHVHSDGRGRNESFCDPPLTAQQEVFSVTWDLLSLDPKSRGWAIILNHAWVSIQTWPDSDQGTHWAGVKLHPSGAELLVKGSVLWPLDPTPAPMAPDEAWEIIHPTRETRALTASLASTLRETLSKT